MAAHPGEIGDRVDDQSREFVTAGDTECRVTWRFGIRCEGGLRAQYFDIGAGPMC